MFITITLAVNIDVINFQKIPAGGVLHGATPWPIGAWWVCRDSLPVGAFLAGNQQPGNNCGRFGLLRSPGFAAELSFSRMACWVNRQISGEC
jgi:hypothetical protein